MDAICLPAPLIEAIIDQARAALPEESCGLVAGHQGRAARLYPVENTRHSPVAYEMDPRQQVQAMLAIENDGLELLAIYHSHPAGPAHPSPSDVAQACYPEQAQLIISLAGEEAVVRAFRIAGDLVSEIPVLEA